MKDRISDFIFKYEYEIKGLILFLLCLGGIYFLLYAIGASYSLGIAVGKRMSNGFKVI